VKKGDAVSRRSGEKPEKCNVLSLALAVFGERVLEMAVVRRGCGRKILFLWSCSRHGRPGRRILQKGCGVAGNLCFSVLPWRF